ncbi:MAG: ceramidase domain-containing protein, partial [Rhizobiaceae bacterium]|nr:ceramidase domain-containing protein [Rhizobiaceae bacterium]
MLETLLAPVDLYCERTDASLWSEPVNLLTNLVFLVVGLAGVAMARRNDAGLFAEVLAWWIVVIGIGSAAFHMFANRATVVADVLPIATLVLAMTIFALRRMFGFSWPITLLLFFGFYAAAGLLTWSVPNWLREATNGSTGYLAAFVGLPLFGGVLAARGHPAGRYFLAAFAVFCLALVFRSIDEDVCASLPLGTHFLWHLFNGTMLGILIVAIARHG